MRVFQASDEGFPLVRQGRAVEGIKEGRREEGGARSLSPGGGGSITPIFRMF